MLHAVKCIELRLTRAPAITDKTCYRPGGGEGPPRAQLCTYATQATFGGVCARVCVSVCVWGRGGAACPGTEADRLQLEVHVFGRGCGSSHTVVGPP